MAKADQTKAAGVTSVLRAFELLEHFRTVRRPQSLKDLVEAFGYPSSSIADLLKTLSGSGYIAFDNSSRTYFPTTRLSELGDWVTSKVVMQGPPFATMKTLRRLTGETVLLGTPNDLEILYLAVFEATQPIQYVMSGRRAHRAIVQSSVGTALLSAEDDDFLERIWRRSIARGLIDRKTLPFEQLHKRIETCRADGYTLNRDASNPGASVVAAFVPAPYNGLHLAIGVGGPTERIHAKADKIANVLRKQVQKLADTLIHVKSSD